MPFDDNKYHGAATKGEIGGVALDTTMALAQITIALQKLAEHPDSGDIKSEIAEITRARHSLWERFIRLTGYVPE